MGLRLINMQAFFSSTQNLYVLGVGEKNNNKLILMSLESLKKKRKGVGLKKYLKK